MSSRRPLSPKPKNPAARKGLRYERKVGEALGTWAKRSPGFKLYSQWQLEDPSGNLHIPDFILANSTIAILLEAKLTFTLAAFDQLFRYAPLVASRLGVPVVLCQVAMNLTPQASAPERVSGLEALLRSAHEGPFHWHLMFPGAANL